MQLPKRMPKKLQNERQAELNAKEFPSEMWFLKQLNKNNINGFRRNVCLDGRFFGDFVWQKKRIVVEIDSSSHKGKEDYDRMRDSRLKKIGFKVYRIKFNDEKKLVEVISLLNSLPKPVVSSGKSAQKKEKINALKQKRLEQIKSFQETLKKKKALIFAFSQAKRMGHDKGNLFLEKTLIRLNLTIDEAKKLI